MRSGHGRRWGAAVALGLLRAASGGASEAPQVRDAIDWPSFMARHDLTWDEIPRAWPEGAFIGNGLLGSMIYALPGEALRFDAGRSDVCDRGNRIPIGRFELVPTGAVQGGDMRLDLWNAEARGRVRTDRGEVLWRAFTHAVDLVNVVERRAQGGEDAARMVFRHEPALDARKTYKKEPIPDSERNPAPRTGRTDRVEWCVQPFKAGGGYAVAWAEGPGEGGSRVFAWTVDHAASGEPSADAATKRMAAALAQGVPALAASHRAWWHAYWPEGFLSIPDTRLESFYWIQMYKLASATHADRPAIDLMGPWFRSTPWPRIWWNLNIQLTYWPVYTANRLELGESLTRMLDAGTSNLVANVPEAMRADSAGIGRTSSYDCRGGAGSELGNLTWAMHNYWLQYRHSCDEAMLRERLFPLLKRSAMFMIRNLQPGDDGRLHFPADTSPEYPERAPDTNYNLGILRWALQTLIAIDRRLGTRDPAAAAWRETLEKLAPFPVDEKTGLMIGRGVPLAVSHRHFSHLLLFYPLHVLSPDDPTVRPLLEKSLDHWIGFEGALQGYSFTGASAMSSWLGRKDAAVSLLNQFVDRYVKANTMYLEAGPVIETPLAGAAALHEILLQSSPGEPFGADIRVFPAVPDTWPDAAIRNLRAEGAFLVSALRRGGRTRWVQVTSLAGAPLRIETGFADAAAVAGGRDLPVEAAEAGSRRLGTVKLKKGETALLFERSSPPSADELALKPVAAQAERQNWFGSRKVPPIRADASGTLLLAATNAHIRGQMLIERKAAGGNIGRWISEHDFPSWKVDLPGAGRYGVSASYASTGGGRVLALCAVAGGRTNRLEFTTRATGGFERFQRQDAGTMDLSNPGICEFTLRPADGKAPVINLENLRLQPVPAGP